ncbi:unnamed protein product [Ambrosiozyma monospora]|uniref:protein-tyrosine-phosphatase n=1 Tax=Ambrosiozyma monospora TaxID=43982 RepID=A0A9W7DFD4_AMBMO|nr:unnamed protein product [Ambrosiozyma monospora]
MSLSLSTESPAKSSDSVSVPVPVNVSVNVPVKQQIQRQRQRHRLRPNQNTHNQQQQQQQQHQQQTKQYLRLDTETSNNNNNNNNSSVQNKLSCPVPNTASTLSHSVSHPQLSQRNIQMLQGQVEKQAQAQPEYPYSQSQSQSQIRTQQEHDGQVQQEQNFQQHQQPQQTQSQRENSPMSVSASTAKPELAPAPILSLPGSTISSASSSTASSPSKKQARNPPPSLYLNVKHCNTDTALVIENHTSHPYTQTKPQKTRRAMNMKKLQLDLSTSPPNRAFNNGFSKSVNSSPQMKLPPLFRSPSMASTSSVSSPMQGNFSDSKLNLCRAPPRHKISTLSLTIPTTNNNNNGNNYLRDGGLKTGIPKFNSGSNGSEPGSSFFGLGVSGVGENSDDSPGSISSFEGSTYNGMPPPTITNSRYLQRRHHSPSSSNIKPQTITHSFQSLHLSDGEYGAGDNSGFYSSSKLMDPSNFRNAYPQGPVCVLEPNLYLYSEPTFDQLNDYDVIINVAQEIKDYSSQLKNAPDDENQNEDEDKHQHQKQQDESSTTTTNTPNGTTTTTTSKLNAKVGYTGRQKKIQYYFIPWTHNSRLVSDFPRLTQIIDDALLSNKKVLIHCQCGVSRSASLILAYFMKVNKTGYNDAYNQLKLKAPLISPNLSLIYELMEWGNYLGYSNNASNSSSSSSSSESGEDGEGSNGSRRGRDTSPSPDTSPLGKSGFEDDDDDDDDDL